MSELEHQPLDLEGEESPLHPLDVMDAEQREYKVEERIENELEHGVTYGEILESLGGYAGAERVVGTDYAQYMQEMLLQEALADKGEQV